MNHDTYSIFVQANWANRINLYNNNYILQKYVEQSVQCAQNVTCSYYTDRVKGINFYIKFNIIIFSIRIKQLPCIYKIYNIKYAVRII